MAYKSSEIERLANLLAANAVFKFDYKMFINKTRKLLIVEGITDHTFIKQLLNDCVDCIIAANVFNSNNLFRTSLSETINVKDAIVKVIAGITHLTPNIVKYDSEVDKWDLYGLVDSDCDSSSNIHLSPRLFVTDTYDLETLLLSTDNKLLSKLNECDINQNDISHAYFIAYQLSIIRKVLSAHHNELDVHIISCGSRNVDFSCFVHEEKINVPDLIEYIGNNMAHKISSRRIIRIIHNVCENKALKKKLDIDGFWGQTLQDFNKSIPSDYWFLVNGHDILQLILYFSHDAATAFSNTKGYSINRSFEMSLIASYDYTQFSLTKLNEKMRQNGLIRV